MTRSSSPHAIVVGGSLGGLLAATTLRAAGWSVDVFERSPSALDSRGGGIVLQPDVLAAFRFAGVAQGEVLGRSSPPERVRRQCVVQWSSLTGGGHGLSSW